MGVLARWSVALALAVPLVVWSADTGKDLLTAAGRGDTPRVGALLDAGANIEARDKKSGRTPLLTAAHEGHPDTIRLLLEKGANPAARDRDGLSAFGLALLSLDGQPRDATLAALPRPPAIRLSLSAAWTPVDMVSSCFLGREELTRLVAQLHPDSLVVGALADFARANSKGAVDLVRSDSQGPTAAINVAAPGSNRRRRRDPARGAARAFLRQPVGSAEPCNRRART